MKPKPPAGTISASKIKRGIDYYLTFDFYPHGGTKVRFVRDENYQSVAYKIMRHEAGTEYRVSIRAWLFEVNPVG